MRKSIWLSRYGVLRLSGVAPGFDLEPGPGPDHAAGKTAEVLELLLRHLQQHRLFETVRCVVGGARLTCGDAKLRRLAPVGPPEPWQDGFGHSVGPGFTHVTTPEVNLLWFAWAAAKRHTITLEVIGGSHLSGSSGDAVTRRCAVGEIRTLEIGVGDGLIIDARLWRRLIPPAEPGLVAALSLVPLADARGA